MKPHHRKLQEPYNDAPLESPTTNPSFQNSSSNSNTSSPPPVKEPSSTKPPPTLQPLQQQYYTSPGFDSSMALTVLVLLTALFFMGFFSIYIRRLSSVNPSEDFSSYRDRGPRPASNTPNRPSRVSANSRRGVDPKVVKSLPVYSYYRGNIKYQIECAICLGEFEEKETVKMIPKCEHVFHLECIDTWLKMHVTCPVCRGTQFFHEKGGGGELGEVQERADQRMSQGHGISTVEDGGTSTELSEVGTLDIRRSDSC